VQGHTPIASPVRKFYSSGMIYKGGTNSALWALMKKYKVDVYLAGEVHDVTGHYVDGIAQISHGGLAYRGNANYMVGEIVGDTLTFTSKQFTGTADWDTARMWQTDMTKSKPVSITYTNPPRRCRRDADNEQQYAHQPQRQPFSLSVAIRHSD